MVRFDAMESLGFRFAGMTDRSNGDCSSRGGLANREAAREAFRLPMLCTVSQVHGNEMVDATELANAPASQRIEADGIATDRDTFCLGISVADCVPVFLADPKQGAIALLHAGREGTRKRIVEAGVRFLCARYGSDARNLHAYIGPSAGPRDYEVSTERADAWRAAGFRANGRLLDLWETNAMILEAAGVPRACIHIDGRCTIASGAFFSLRRGDESDRNLALFAR